jgi:hypothetical protein
MRLINMTGKLTTSKNLLAVTIILLGGLAFFSLTAWENKADKKDIDAWAQERNLTGGRCAADTLPLIAAPISERETAESIESKRIKGFIGLSTTAVGQVSFERTAGNTRGSNEADSKTVTRHQSVRENFRSAHLDSPLPKY